MKHLTPTRYNTSEKKVNVSSNMKTIKVSKVTVLIIIIVLLLISLFVMIKYISVQNKYINELEFHNNTVDNQNIILESNLESAINSLSTSKIRKTILLQNIVDITSKHVKVTAYHPASGGINSDADPSMTATMTRHKAGYTCAISSKLVEAGWLGKEIYIEGMGVFLANDRLAKGIPGYQIDLCKRSYKSAMKFGTHESVLATIADRRKINKKIKEN